MLTPHAHTVLVYLTDSIETERHFNAIVRGTAIHTTGVQGALRELIEKEWVSVERERNRKVYGLTAQAKEQLLERGKQTEGNPARVGLPGSPLTLTLFNYAGGAGKTSSTRDLGFELGCLGYKVLLIDHDPQASLTRWLGVNPFELEDRQTLLRTLSSDDAGLPEPLRRYGMDLIPASPKLAGAERILSDDPFALDRLRRSRMKAPYDFILIDAQPSASNLALSAAYASDAMIVPIPVARKGLDALQGTHQVVRSLSRRVPGFEVLLYLPTQFQAGLRDAQGWLEEIKKELPHLAPTLSHRPGVYNGAHTEGVPIGVYRPHDEARREVQAVVHHLLERLGSSFPFTEPNV